LLADKIITISESARDDLIEKFGADPDKLIIAPCGVDTSFFRPVSSRKFIKKLGIQKKYLLFVGTIEPRKNLARLIRAYDALPESYKDEYELVLVGGRGWNDSEIQAEIHRPRTCGRIVVPGYVDDAVIPELYSHATALLYPSLYEGFGLPIIEALACGTPVLTAKNSSLEEVARDAAYYVDEFSESSISAGIRKLIDSSTLCSMIVERGQSRVAKYQWDSAAKTIHKALAT
jgi:alpha-1,3-rhamnosyl/mannosyltransferase